MRPEVLYPLFAELTALPGVGIKLAARLAQLAGERVVDLLWHLPTGIIDRRLSPALATLVPPCTATVRVRIEHHEPARTQRRPYRIHCSDPSGYLLIVYFNAQPDYLLRLLPPGAERIVSGDVERYGEILQMAHPDHVRDPELPGDPLPEHEPVYPLTAGVTPKVLRRAIEAALQRAPDLDEWLDTQLVAQRGWPRWRDALLRTHAPASAAELAPLSAARARLAYDELLASQLALAIVRQRARRQPGRARPGTGVLTTAVRARLPFALTESQEQALAEITLDLAAPSRMLRLLQGDVGSGKTIVAMLAMLQVVESGGQAALMAPTELLARQHVTSLAPLARAAGVRLDLLTGREKEAARRPVLDGLATGATAIVVGTHALLQEGVDFHDLGLAVIDEQHRFGVDQRLALAEKGTAADVLVMSATPIPRTLTMLLWGDLDHSRLTEKPPGRQPIDTRVVPLDRLDDVIAALGRMLAQDGKAYWVCPLVESSEALDLAAAEERLRRLDSVFPRRVGLVHGRMKTAERTQVMQRFRAGPIGILVATTVIEVGVDIPDATVMVIEHAERFGLAQLHQLRGRIGRGAAASTCVLLYAPPITEAARARLAVLRETDDGFRIAEEDLRLRGAGDLLGVRQSGLPDFRIADVALQADLLATAGADARLALDRDPDLASPRGWALRTLLYLFERDQAIRLLRSG